MKKFFFLLLLVCPGLKNLVAQTTGAIKDTAVNTLPKDDSRVFVKAEQMPAYKGGDSAWIQFLNKNLNYPPEAIDKEQQGTVLVGFIVDTTGHISGVDAITKPAKSLVAEAIRIVKLSDGNWEPAVQNGYKVKCLTKRPIQFRIAGN